MCVCVYARVCVYACACMREFIYVSMCTSRLCVYTRVSACVYARARVCMRECVWVCVSEYMYVISVSVCACVCVRVGRISVYTSVLDEYILMSIQ